MSRFILVSIFLYFFSPFVLAQFKISKDIFNNSDLVFLENKGEGKYSNYLSMQINFLPVANLFKELLIDKRISLTSRGESHITVIPPTEYFDVLKNKVSIDEINQIARDSEIQKSQFTIVCLGLGKALIKGKIEKTFYIVLESEDLLKIRAKVQDLFILRGGTKAQFKVNNFYPHITVGFTKRDLHEKDGVVKGAKSCHKKLLLATD